MCATRIERCSSALSLASWACAAASQPYDLSVDMAAKVSAHAAARASVRAATVVRVLPKAAAKRACRQTQRSITPTPAAAGTAPISRVRTAETTSRSTIASHAKWRKISPLSKRWQSLDTSVATSGGASPDGPPRSADGEVPSSRAYTRPVVPMRRFHPPRIVR